MTTEDKAQLITEINHIFDSGANEVRIFEMVRDFIDKINKVASNPFPEDLKIFLSALRFAEHPEIRKESQRLIDTYILKKPNAEQLIAPPQKNQYNTDFKKTDFLEFIEKLKGEIEFERKNNPDKCEGSGWCVQEGIVISVVEAEMIVKLLTETTQ